MLYRHSILLFSLYLFFCNFFRFWGNFDRVSMFPYDHVNLTPWRNRSRRRTSGRQRWSTSDESIIEILDSISINRIESKIWFLKHRIEKISNKTSTSKRHRNGNHRFMTNFVIYFRYIKFRILKALKVETPFRGMCVAP